MSSVPLATGAPENSISDLITRIRSGGRQSLGELLQIYRNYLNVLATTQLDARLRRRMSTSDLVQETMLAAHRDFDQFRGHSEGELLAWLRQILSHHLSHAMERNVYAKKRDIRREVSLDRVAKRIDDSIAGLSNLIPDPMATPSEIVSRRELAAELSDQLAKLKPSYHDVIVYRNLQGCSFDEIAKKMDIKSGAARMLWLRAIAKFKEVCDINVSGGSP
ncbi:sigma-70 family RNA polymerase sigma factor [Aporhodopirellula aestuarii]|uniref:Sigma-70 family RNA polymerase sigma factor n=1 Tax=Aporhodopirellula aestuarii TaxID=2950107 RepID=A0ABT0TZQ3_9BACT|nr:sigma-70 family RNA polymerase sigma factor [Aporhodopirellula aestuarii]MCM2369864.1 sigma-70 family RNA polymerase sigma factor [Aporhodopirellula aestuarii]